MIKINTGICGDEKNELTKKWPIEVTLKRDSGPFLIQWEELDQMFRFIKGQQGFDECFDQTLKIYKDTDY